MPNFSTQYAALVEPRLGTNIGRWIAFSSACRPFGMVNLSPDCRIDGDWGCGYRYDGERILGFSHIHAWQISGVLVMPLTGDDVQREFRSPAAWASPFSHADEICKPGYHRLTLGRSGIVVELTSTLRVGVHRYTFPPGKPAAIGIDLHSTLGPCDMTGGSLRQTGRRSFEGSVINQPTIRKPKPLTIYFAIELDVDGVLQTGDASQAAACVAVGTPDRPVTMRVAISYTSIEGARNNLAVESNGKSFDDVAIESNSEWNEWLGRIEVEGGTPESRGRFYTDLWASLLGRRTVSDHDGKYIDNTGPLPTVRQIPLTPAGLPRYRHFNSDSFWGAQWTLIPLWCLAYPEIIDQFCRCFMDMYRNGGLIPRGPAGGNYTFVMTSAQTTPLFAAAINQGIYRPENPAEVYAAVRKNHLPGGLMSKAGYEHATCRGGGIDDYIALGYIPEDLPKVGFHTNGASQTIEHAYNDHALAILARTIGTPADVELFERRSRNYQNVFDRSIGFARPRERGGAWITPFDPNSRRGWTEANAWSATFASVHDVPGMIECFGSANRLMDRLEDGLRRCRDRGFFVPHEKHEDVPFDFGNEPSLAAPYWFHLCGRPDRTQAWLDEIFAAVKSGNQPTDTWAGDEDQGIMGAWNVLVSIGRFCCDPSPANPRWLHTHPRFERVTIHPPTKLPDE